MEPRTKALLAALPLASSRRRRRLALVAGAGGLLAAWVGWGLYVDRTTERVPYDTLAEFDGVELRRYPRTVLVETTADDERTAFGRLFRYISGANAGEEQVSTTAPVASDADGAEAEDADAEGAEPEGTEIPMTAPVRTTPTGRTGGADTTAESDADSDGERVPMTAPVRTTAESGAGRTDGGVTMAFYLPPEYTPGTAPTPTDPRVRLVVEPPRTLAVRQFSWYATDDRVARNLRRLRDALDDRGVEPLGRPTVLQYDAPWTPPFMRSNEVAVEVDAGAFETVEGV